MSNNKNLKIAGKAKNDEFYTQLSDIENELRHYIKHFKNKTILCNCDDPRISGFFKYFSLNFEKLKLKKLITTCYKNQQMDLFSQNDSERAIWLEYNGDKNKNRIPDIDEIGTTNLKGDGDFSSDECIEILKKADIVVTNPPFSLFRKYVAQLMKYRKKFIIIGNQNAITYKDIFPLIKDNKIWLGASIHGGDREFGIPDNYIPRSKSLRIDESGKKFVRVVGVRWFTNIDYKKRHEDLILYKKYNKTEYPKYNNYNAINVNKTKEIPIDYDDVMGVPITFMDKYNPDQFDIIGLANDKREIHDAFVQGKPVYLDEQHKKFVGMVLNEKNKLRATYARIIIKSKRRSRK